MKNHNQTNNVLSLISSPTPEQIWEFIQASPERIQRLQEIAHQAFLPEYIGTDSRKFVNASVKSSYYFLELANEIGDKCQLQPKKHSELLVA